MQITAVFHRKRLRLATGVLLAMLLLAAGFFWYVSDYYRAEDAALDVLASGENIEVRGSLTILSPSYPTDTAIIFYPGAKVEGAAYLPCWTSCGGPASPVFWWRCPSAWPSLMSTPPKT